MHILLPIRNARSTVGVCAITLQSDTNVTICSKILLKRIIEFCIVPSGKKSQIQISHVVNTFNSPLVIVTPTFDVATDSLKASNASCDYHRLG